MTTENTNAGIISSDEQAKKLISLIPEEKKRFMCDTYYDGVFSYAMGEEEIDNTNEWDTDSYGDWQRGYRDAKEYDQIHKVTDYAE